MKLEEQIIDKMARARCDMKRAFEVLKPFPVMREGDYLKRFSQLKTR